MRELSHSEQNTRWILLGLNVAFVILGLIVLIVGSVAINEAKKLSPLDVSEVNWIGVMLILLGMTLGLCGIVGFLGVLFKSTYILWFYTVLLIMAMVIQMIMGLMCISRRGSAAENMARQIEYSFKKYDKKNKNHPTTRSSQLFVNARVEKFR